MLRDELILVDIDDNELGVEQKEKAHSRPMLHRAFSIYLYNDKKELLIQKRAISKYHSGGLWANACCSHPRKGETLKESAIDRLKDELGIETDVKELFSFIYLNKFNDNLYEYELDHVFIGKYNGNINNIKLNKEEVSEVRWVNIKQLKEELVTNPSSFSSWFIISVKKIIEYLEK